MNDKKKNSIREKAENHLYTYGDYLSWSDEKRYELIDGQVYLMTPSPSRRHQKIVVELIRQFSSFLQDKKCEVYTAPFDVRLPEDEEKDEDIKTVIQPDILVVCDEKKLDEKGCKGAPDLVIEIISPSSAGRDRKYKRNLYEKHGVKEYWLVDYSEEIVEVYLLTIDNEYKKAKVYLKENIVPVKVLNELEINLESVFK
ncbi:MAG: Uma2 family endonuclease [Bacillota bacterium]